MKKKCSACFGVAVGIGALVLVTAGVFAFKAWRSRRKLAENPPLTQEAATALPAQPSAGESAAAEPLVS